ncbi:MAG: CsbD family protein [Proteobacteria bacterium]|nr:CsbD family protein [Pseudomonadota bacterium]
MNWEQIEGQWKEVKGLVREKWGKITDDDLTVIAGKKDRLLGKIQTRYGHKKEAAEAELDKFIANVKLKN